MVTNIGEPRSVGEGECLQRGALPEGRFTDVVQAGGKCKLDEGGAATESPRFDSGKRGWEGELDETLATVKGVPTDGRGGEREIDMGEGGATGKHASAGGDEGRREREGAEEGAVSKGAIADGGEGRREREGGEGGAVTKGAFVDVGERRRKRDLGEPGASTKRLPTDGGNVGVEHASGEGAALVEGIFADGRCADGEAEEAQGLEVAPYEGCLLPGRNGWYQKVQALVESARGCTSQAKPQHWKQCVTQPALRGSTARGASCCESRNALRVEPLGHATEQIDRKRVEHGERLFSLSARHHSLHFFSRRALQARRDRGRGYKVCGSLG